MEKELVQHLERVQQRLARLKKDEDRLLTLLNPTKRLLSNVNPTPAMMAGCSQDETADNDDELWLLLEEIQLRSQAIRSSGNVKDENIVKPEETAQAMSHKKRVSFQQQQQQLEKDGLGNGGGDATTTTTTAVKATASVVVGTCAAAVAALPSPPGQSSSRYQPPTRDQVAAILRLTNPVQLQRHLLRALLDNQVMTPIRAKDFFFFISPASLLFFF